VLFVKWSRADKSSYYETVIFSLRFCIRGSIDKTTKSSLRNALSSNHPSRSQSSVTIGTQRKRSFPERRPNFRPLERIRQKKENKWDLCWSRCNKTYQCNAKGLLVFSSTYQNDDQSMILGRNKPVEQGLYWWWDFPREALCVLTFPFRIDRNTFMMAKKLESAAVGEAQFSVECAINSRENICRYASFPFTNARIS